MFIIRRFNDVNFKSFDVKSSVKISDFTPVNFNDQIERLERIKQMHRLISDKTTGTPETFAKKLVVYQN